MKTLTILTGAIVAGLGCSAGSFAGELVGSASSAGMSAASAGSASLRGSSDAISGSSNSASGADDVAAGQYRLTDIAEAGDKQDQLSLSLEPVAQVNQPRRFQLTLPRAAIGSKRFARGDTINVRRHPYGLAFTHQDSPEPFYLVVSGPWERDLQTRIVAN